MEENHQSKTEETEEDKFKEVITTPRPCPYFYQVIGDKIIYPHKEQDGNENIKS